MVIGIKPQLTSEAASQINRQKRIDPETEADFARGRSDEKRLQKFHFYLNGLQDGERELPISVDEIAHALDYALMLICRRRGEFRKAVS
jgi:hypothetical protein